MQALPLIVPAGMGPGVHHTAPGLLEHVSGSKEAIFGLAKRLFDLGDAETPTPVQVQVCLGMLESYTAGEAADKGVIDAKQALEDLRASLPAIQEQIAQGKGDELLGEINFLFIGSEVGGSERSHKLMHTAAKAIRVDVGQAFAYHQPGSSSGGGGPAILRSGGDLSLRKAEAPVETKSTDAKQESGALSMVTTSVGLAQAGIDIGYQASYLVSIGLLKRDIRNDKARIEELRVILEPNQLETTELKQLENDLPLKEAELSKLQQESKYLFKTATLLDLGRIANFSGALTALLGSAKDTAIGIASASLAGVGMGALFGVAALRRIISDKQKLKRAAAEVTFIGRQEEWKATGVSSNPEISAKVKELKGKMCEARTNALSERTKKDLKVSVFRNALYTASSFATAAVGILKIIAAAGATVLGGAIAATGIGITVLFLSALVIGIGYMIHKNRESIGTWIKLKTTWKFREWRLRNQLDKADELAALQLKITEASSKPGGFGTQLNVLKKTFTKWRKQRAYAKAAAGLKETGIAPALARGCETAAKELLAAHKALDEAQAVAKQVAMHAKVEDREAAQGLTKLLDEIQTPEEAKAIIKALAKTGPFADLSEAAKRALASSSPVIKLRELVYDWVSSQPQQREQVA